MTELTERRKADRARMAGAVAELARTHGLGVMVYPELPGTRRCSVDLHGPHGLGLTVSFDGASPQPVADTYVLSWHGSSRRLRQAAFGSVNRHHGHKATDVARGFPELAALLARRLSAIAGGSAFTAES